MQRIQYSCALFSVYNILIINLNLYFLLTIHKYYCLLKQNHLQNSARLVNINLMLETNVWI